MNSEEPTQADTETANGEPAVEEIALHAYAIWENEGRPDGHDIDHWLQAEAQLRAIRAHR